MKVLNLLLFFVFSSSVFGQHIFFEPYLEQKPLEHAIKNLSDSDRIISSLMGRYDQSYLRPQLDLPGLVDDFDYREYRPRCLEVRTKYSQAMIYWAEIIKYMKCIQQAVAYKGFQVNHLVKAIKALREKVDETYTSDLYEKEHILKYVWKVDDLQSGYVKSIKYANQVVEFKKDEFEKNFFKVELTEDTVQIHRTLSDKEICLEHNNIMVEYALEGGGSKWFVSSYTF